MLNDESDTDGAPLTSWQFIEEFNGLNEDIVAIEIKINVHEWIDEVLGREDYIRCRRSHLKLRQVLDHRIRSKVGNIQLIPVLCSTVLSSFIKSTIEIRFSTTGVPRIKATSI